jgi:uncharacterized protein
VAKPMRLCVATRTQRPIGGLIRFVVGRDGTLIPDIARGLAGRGVWVTARRKPIMDAQRRTAFSRSLKREVTVPADLADRVEGLLEQAALKALWTACKAGLVKCAGAIEAGLDRDTIVAWLSPRGTRHDGVGKLLAKPGLDNADLKIIDAFTSSQLDLALRRLNVVHAALLGGRASTMFLARCQILECFRADDADMSARGG